MCRQEKLSVMLSVLILVAAVGVLGSAVRARLLTAAGWANLPGRTREGDSPLAWMGLGFGILCVWMVAGSIAAGSVQGSPVAAGEGAAVGASPAQVLREKAVPALAGYLAAGGAGLAGAAWLGRRGGRWGGGTGAGRAPDWSVVRGRDVPRSVVWFAGAVWPVLGLGIASAWGYALVTGHPPAPIAHPTLEVLAKHPGEPWAMGLIAGAVLGAPVVEELVFRACLQTAVLRATGHRGAAIGVATAAFVSVHLGLPAHTLLPLAGLSVALGVAYERTRSLAVPVVMHALYNALNVVLVLMGIGG